MHRLKSDRLQIMKAVIYARISQDRTGQSLGVARQIEECESLARQRAIQVLHTLTDNDISAYKKSVKRPGWNQVLDLVQSGDVDTIIVWNLDRAYKRLADLQNLLEQIQDRSVMILAVQGGALDLTTPPGRAMANVMASMAQLEVETKGERQALKHRELARAGAWKGGRKPWGYEEDGVTIDPKQAAAIQTAAQMLINGSGTQATSRWITEELGKWISPVVIKRILMAPRIAGFRQHWSQKDRDRWEKERRSGAHNGEPTPTGTLYQAEWQGIISVAQWRSVCAVFNERGGARPSRAPLSLLSGVIKCDQCGHTLGYSKASYKCAGKSTADGDQGCGQVAISTAAIESLVTTDIEAILAGDPFIYPTEQAQELNTDTTGDELDRLRNNFQEAAKLYGDQVITSAELRDIRSRIGTRIAELESAMDEAALQHARAVMVLPTLAVWREATTIEKSLLVRRIYSEIRIRKSEGGRRSGSKFNPERVTLIRRQS